MGKMSGFVFQDDYLEQLAMLSDQELGRLVRALVKYHRTGEVQELAGRESVAFGFIKFDIDRIDKAYQAKCDKNRENINNRYQLNKDEKENNERIQPNTNADKENNKLFKETLSFNKESEKKSGKRFSPPTLEDVEEYCISRNSSVIPEKFIDYYSAIGWKIGGKSQMKDWKAAVRNWEKMDRDRDAAAYDMAL